MSEAWSHVGDHLEGRRDVPQVTGHRLLEKQQLETEGFNVPLLLVDAGVHLEDLWQQLRLVLVQGLHGQGDRPLAHGTHLDHFPMQQPQLLSILFAH